MSEPLLHRAFEGATTSALFAAGYDLLVRLMAGGREEALREEMLDAAGLSAGERVLDVGCGTGTLALAAARRVGPSGAVQGVDPGPGMVARARAKVERAGREVQIDVASAQALPLPDQSFDVALCTLALHHMPPADWGAALSEIGRVLRPGGRLLIVEVGYSQGGSAVSWAHGHAARGVWEALPPALEQADFTVVASGGLKLRSLGWVLARR